MQNPHDYFLGLSIDQSIGWSLTDTSYQLLSRRINGQRSYLWGARLFSEAETAQDRRAIRINRRNLDRKKKRLIYTRKVFENEINKIDPDFFKRLDNSKYWLEDKADSLPASILFADKEYSDRDYKQQYPTIYHLKKDLILSAEPHDVRLVFLAVSHYMKHRGHFLNASLSSDKLNVDLVKNYENLQQAAADLDVFLPGIANAEKFKDVLCNADLSLSKKKKALQETLYMDKTKKNGINILNLICGSDVNLASIYGAEVFEEPVKLSLREENVEESIEALASSLEDGGHLLKVAKEIFDGSLLYELLDGEDYLCFAYVKRYEEHKKDLALLKKVLKKYDIEAAKDMFDRESIPNNYAHYVGHISTKKGLYTKIAKSSYEDFKKYATKVLSSFLPEKTDDNEQLPVDPEVKYLLDKLESNQLLCKQHTSDNRYVPHQVYLAELKVILENARTYLPFLSEIDPESGQTVSQNILDIFSFRRPYFIGPVSDQSPYAWSHFREGKAAGPIFPWNIHEKVDFALSAQNFMESLIGQCTYLPQYKVMPKQSLLYEKFICLNYINNLLVKGEKPSVEIKQKIYNELYCKGKKVTTSLLSDFLFEEGIIPPGHIDLIGGLNDKAAPSLTTYKKLKKVFSEEILNDPAYQDGLEAIVLMATAFHDSKDLLKQKLEEEYGGFMSKEQIARFCDIDFLGWGNLSKEFLFLKGKMLQGTDDEKDAWGEKNIIDALWSSNYNLMELLGAKFSYKKEIATIAKAVKPLQKWTVDDLNAEYMPPNLKRQVWQMKQILAEVEKTMGGPPKKIFVQLSGGNPRRLTGKERKKTLLQIYKKKKKNEKRDWRQEIMDTPEQAFSSDKLYLYYLQKGRCLYTGKEIPLEDLYTDAYNRDHIIPKSIKVDNSPENNLILVSSDVNKDKSNVYPINEFDPRIQPRMQDYWLILKEEGLMSQEKYNLLIRTAPLTDEDRAAFIEERLHEKGWGAKTIRRILKQSYPENKTKIVYVKRAFVSDFRNTFHLSKARTLNKCYLAYDAYLTTVVGNVYDELFGGEDSSLKFIKKNVPYNLSKMYSRTIYDKNDNPVWIAAPNLGEDMGTIVTVKDQLRNKSVLMSKKADYKDGCLSNMTIKGKADAEKSVKKNPMGYLPTKSSDARLCDVTKYGGRTTIATSCFVLVEYTLINKKGETETNRILEPVPYYLGITSGDDPRLKSYLLKRHESTSDETILSMDIRYFAVKPNDLLKLDGFTYYITGVSDTMFSARPAVPIFLSDRNVEYISKMERSDEFLDRTQDGLPYFTKEANIALYDDLVETHKKPPFSAKKTNIVAFLDNAETRTLFADLTVSKQCIILLRMLLVLSGEMKMVNFVDIGGKANMGSITFSRNLSKIQEAILIKRSITGIKESRIDLLTV